MNRTRGGPTPIDRGVSRRIRDRVLPPARKPRAVCCPLRPPPGHRAGYTDLRYRVAEFKIDSVRHPSRWR
jgi:hypothetical protein